MTTTVRVLVEGNKACEVRVVEETDGTGILYATKVIKPGEYATLTIHGEQQLTVKETGEFL